MRGNEDSVERFYESKETGIVSMKRGNKLDCSAHESDEQLRLTKRKIKDIYIQ